MFIEDEHMLLPSEDAKESSPDSLAWLPRESGFPEPPSLPEVYTDVNVVPEHEKMELEQAISTIEGGLEELRLKQKKLDKKRREILNKILDIKGSIRVFCRLRPFLSMDRRRIGEPISVGTEKVVVRWAGSRKEFLFDRVLTQESSQEDVFVEVEPILKSALDGHNVCIFSYGQTGTGKTFTMDGTKDQPGVVPRALEGLFHQASLTSSAPITFSMSMVELYMGSLKDLLAPKPSFKSREATRCNLNIQADPNGLVEIEGLTEVQISDFTMASWWYNRGRRVRSTAWTNVNEASSRSHCLTRITICQHWDPLKGQPEISKLWMIDLGGSERVLKTGATGLTLDEGRAINLSLSALGDVIAALRRKRGHIPFRNSKLTQILRDSLGDGSKVLMLVHISQCEEDVNETACSLNFAKRVRGIETFREVPEDLKKQKEKKIAEFDKEMSEIEEERKKIGNQIKDVELLLSKNKRLLSTTYHLVEDETPRTPGKDFRGVSGTPYTFEKVSKTNIHNSLPRFMTPTAASRHRHGSVEKEPSGKSGILRSMTRNLIQLSVSQSASYNSPRLRAMLQNSSARSHYGVKIKSLPVSESHKCDHMYSKPHSLRRSKTMTSSIPNLRVTVHQHRRKMSDVILQ